MIFLELFNYKRKKKQNKNGKNKTKNSLQSYKKDTTYVTVDALITMIFTSQYQHYIQWYHKLHSLLF